MTGAQNADHLVHVVVVGAEYGHSAQFFRNPARRPRIQPLGRNQNHKHVPSLAKRRHRVRNSSEILLVRTIGFRPRIMEVNGPVMTVLVSSSHLAGRQFSD